MLPDGETGQARALEVRARRCELALGEMAHAHDDPAAYALGLGVVTAAIGAPFFLFVLRRSRGHI